MLIASSIDSWLERLDERVRQILDKKGNDRSLRYALTTAHGLPSTRVETTRKTAITSRFDQEQSIRQSTDEGAMERRILVVDDSELICQQLSQLLALPDRQISIATDGTAALEWLVEHSCSLVLTDLRLPGISGLDLIKEIRKKDLPVTVIVMTGFATVEDTVEAIKLGAYDLVQKPLDTVSLEVLVNHALEDRRLIEIGRAHV